MSKEYNLISDFDYRIIAAFFAGLSTGKARATTPRPPRAELHRRTAAPSRIADIGCGTDARRRCSHRRSTVVTAVDLLPEMIEDCTGEWRPKAGREQVTGIVASMLSLPFAEASFDCCGPKVPFTISASRRG